MRMEDKTRMRKLTVLVGGGLFWWGPRSRAPWAHPLIWACRYRQLQHLFQYHNKHKTGSSGSNEREVAGAVKIESD